MALLYLADEGPSPSVRLLRSQTPVAAICRCLTHIPEESIFFTHIKPKYLHVRSAEWDDPTGMFMALQQRGAKVIVPVARRNWLARDISAIDMHMTAEIKRGTDPRKTCNHAVFARATCPGNCVRTFRMYEKAIEQGT